MRRLLAVAGLAALGLSLGAPAAMAHEDANVHTLAWGASPDPTTAKDGAQVFSNDEVVAAVADFDDGVKSWDVVIRPVGGGQPSTCHEDLAKKDGGDYPSKVYINCPWDTTRATNHTLPGYTSDADAKQPTFQRTWQSQDLGPSVNGKYTVEITVFNSGQPYNCFLGCNPAIPTAPHPLYQSGSNPPRWRELWVVNEVSDPTGVTNVYNPSTNRITVDWAPNPEPDVSYVVQEKVGDGTFKKIADVPGNATSYDRVIEQPGTYQYKVGAVRPAPTSDGGSGAAATKKSNYVATQAVDIAQVSPPTTAGSSGPDGTVDGGDPGVSMPGDTSSSTAPGAHVTAPAKGPAPAGRSGGGAIAARPFGTSSRPTGSTAPAGESEGEGPDEGFSTALPYFEQDGATDGLGDGEEAPESMSNIVTVPRPRDTRALLVPLAEGLAVFVFAMQLTVLMRRRPAVAAVEDDFDDWMGL